MNEPSEVTTRLPEKKKLDYRFPAVEEATAEFRVALPPFPTAPDGFLGTLEELLDGVRSQRLQLSELPVAHVIEQYLRFREALEPNEAHERISDFLPLAATLIHYKSELFLRQSEPQQPSPEEEALEEIQRAERRRREEPARLIQPQTAADPNTGRLTLLDLMVLLNEVRNRLRDALTVEEDEFTTSDAMKWIRDSLPHAAAVDVETYFEQCQTRGSQASVFLAVLEMSRHGVIDCHQAETFSPLWIARQPASH